MRPELISSGKEAAKAEQRRVEAASMRPELISSGKRSRREEFARLLTVASMRPELISSGKSRNAGLGAGPT